MVADDARYRVDEGDPIARFIQERLGLSWSTFFLATFIIYGPVEKLLLPALGGYLRLTGPVTSWIPDVEALLTGFVEFPVFFAYYLWTCTGVGLVFRDIAASGIAADAARYDAFWDEARASLNRRSVSVASGILATAVMVYFQRVVWAPGQDPIPWFERTQATAWPRVVSLLLIGATAYAIFQIVIRETLALMWLGRLWRRLGDTLTVRPYHDDGAGGWGAVGEHALRLSIFLLALLLFLVMGGMLPGLRAGTASFSFWNSWLTICLLAYLGAVALVLGPLVLTPHRVMTSRRAEGLRDISRELERQFNDHATAIAADGGASLAATNTRVKDLRGLRTQFMEDFPVWPFNRELQVKLGLTSLPVMLLPGINYFLGRVANLLIQTFKP